MAIRPSYGTGLGRIKARPLGKFSKVTSEDGHVSHGPKGFTTRMKGQMDSTHETEEAAHAHLDKLRKRRDFPYKEGVSRMIQLKDAGLL